MLQKNEKNCAFVGPLFVGAPVRPNMLNMPKSDFTLSHVYHGNALHIF